MCSSMTLFETCVADSLRLSQMRTFSLGPFEVNRTFLKVPFPTQFEQRALKVSAWTAELFVEFRAFKCHMYSCVSGLSLLI